MQLYAPPAHIKAPDYDDYEDYSEYGAAETAYVAELQAWAKRLAPSSNIAGELISLPWADGAAMYIIIQSSGRHGIMTVPVGDAWRDPNFERYATVTALKDMVARNRRAVRARARMA